MLQAGDSVEVLGNEDGFHGSWALAKVVEVRLLLAWPGRFKVPPRELNVFEVLEPRSTSYDLL